MKQCRLYNKSNKTSWLSFVYSQPSTCNSATQGKPDSYVCRGYVAVQSLQPCVVSYVHFHIYYCCESYLWAWWWSWKYFQEFFCVNPLNVQWCAVVSMGCVAYLVCLQTLLHTLYHLEPRTDQPPWDMAHISMGTSMSSNKDMWFVIIFEKQEHNRQWNPP